MRYSRPAVVLGLVLAFLATSCGAVASQGKEWSDAVSAGLASGMAVTLAGTSYFPSGLNPLLPAVCWLIAIAFFAFALLVLVKALTRVESASGLREPWQSLNRLATSGSIWVTSSTNRIPAFVALVGLGLLALIAGVSSSQSGWTWPEHAFPAAVRSELSLPSQPHDTDEGSVIAADGSVGRIVRAPDKLLVRDIPRAGSYVGATHWPSLGDTPKPQSVKVTVNVSDFWLYALLPIASGVSIGYLIIRFLRRGLYVARAGRVGDRVRKEARAYRGYSMRVLAEEWMGLVIDDLKGNQVDSAKKRLDNLEAYLDLYRLFCVQVVHLKVLQERVWKTIQGTADGSSGLRKGELPAFVRARQLLDGRSFRFPPQGAEDEQATLLKRVQKAVQDASDWLTLLETTYTLVADYLDHLEAMAQNAPQSLRGKLRSTAKDVRKQARIVLLAGDVSKVEGFKEVADALYAAVVEQRAPTPTERIWLNAMTVRFVPPVLPARLPGATLEPTREGAKRRWVRLLQTYRVTEREMTLLAGSLAVASGFLTLYLSNPSWGLPGDYVKAFLWGSVVSEGLKWANSTLTRILPSA
jgi:hypothetical protein